MAHHFYRFLFTVNVIRQMAPLFSKVDSNKLWHDVQSEETVICAKFGKDMFNIYKVIGRKTKWPRFFGLPDMSSGMYPAIWVKTRKLCYSKDDRAMRAI